MVFSSPVFSEYNNVYSWHIEVPDDVYQHFKEQNIKRVLATIEGKVTIHCGLLSKGNGIYYIMLNKEIRKQLGLVAEQVVQVSLEEDTSEFGMAVCEELTEMLAQDEEGRAYFMKLTPGKQRNIIHWVGNVKSSDIRIRRAIVAMNHLKMQQGKLDFKLLHQEIKEANQSGL
ncbi:YdeI/OmpD-associated family protein [Sanyastnella coralliicola]|uniref:YdeI/OmpD-associated family protein n=1 Tax=Sanyastnella coralliicola TaxID=3069118 RepID=UPI0027BAD120|nr:YdeI/OmpD-associated family protein [Longitalea sp. SCSIO 12813]